MSCSRIRSLIDRQLQLEDGGATQLPEQIRSHTERCPQCAEYLERSEQLVQLLKGLPDAEPDPDLCQQVMQQLTGQSAEPVRRLQPPAQARLLADSTVQQQTEQLERQLRTLPEIEPAPELCQQVMQLLRELPPRPAAEPVPQRARFALVGQQVLRNLSYLLAGAALVIGSIVELPAAWLDRLSLLPTPLELPTLLPTDPSSLLLSFATLLLLLGIWASPTPPPQRHGVPPRSP